MRTQSVAIVYTNYKGKAAERTIVPKHLWFGVTEYHSEPQWLLDAFDQEKQADRTFAMKDIHSWKEIGESNGSRTSEEMPLVLNDMPRRDPKLRDR